MGIAFIEAKADRFKAKRDKKYEEQMASENLFSGLPDTIARTYRCKSTSDQLPAAGTMVLLYISRNSILVLHLNQEIGSVMSPDAADVRALMKEAHTDMISAQVVDARPLSKVFSVQPQVPFN